MSTVINLRVSEEDAASWKASAQAEGVSLSRWIRDRVGTPESVGTPVPVVVPSRSGLRKAAVMRKAAASVEMVNRTPVRFGSILERTPGKLDPRCVQANLHWRGSCKVCGG